MKEFRLRGSLAVIIFSLSAMSAFAQVVIEGGPNGARISDRNGRTEGPIQSSSRNTVTTPLTNPPSGNVELISPVRNIDFSVFVREATRPDESTVVSAATQPATEPATIPVVDVGRQLKLNRMESELGMTKTAAFSGVAYRADLLFQKGMPNVSELAKPTLDSLAGYLAIAGGKSVSVIYHFHPGETAALGKDRSESVANYLSLKTGIDASKFKLETQKVTKKTLTRNGSSVGELRPEYLSQVTIILHRV